MQWPLWGIGTAMGLAIVWAIGRAIDHAERRSARVDRRAHARPAGQQRANLAPWERS